jgi:hypothetical protein
LKGAEIVHQNKKKVYMINNFHGETFVAFLDISGFKVLMKKGKARDVLDVFYQTGYDVLSNHSGEVDGIFVSDCGIVLVANQNRDKVEKFTKILEVIKSINLQMLQHDFMLKTSIAFGEFSYNNRIEFNGLSKNMLYGNAYLTAYLNNDKVETSLCKIIVDDSFPINISHENFPLIKRKRNNYYYYWNLENENNIDDFEMQYQDSKYIGMLNILKSFRNN